MDNTYYYIRIQHYLEGKLSPEEMHQLEREALDDPFLNDALEGYSQKGLKHEKITLLQKRLYTTIQNQQQEKNRMLFGGQRLGIAAVACLLFILSCLLLWMITTKNQDAQSGSSKQVTMELNTADPIPSGNGLSIARQSKEWSAHPKGGWTAFNRYVHTKKKPLSGKNLVVLQFEVDEDGSPKLFKRLKGDALFVKEAQRLLANGPKWEGGNKAEVEFVFE